MPDYRLYFLDSQNHIKHAMELDCPDDEHAIAIAKQHEDGRPKELWQRGRLVRSFARKFHDA